jgi:bacterioferritin-associated ferredoxin
MQAKDPSEGNREMIVCHCAGVTDHAIRGLIRDGASSMKEIVRATGAGRCCSPCRDEIRSLINDAVAQPHAE